MRERIQPVREDGGSHDDYKETHPSYGKIGGSRVSSTPGESLFGSDFTHRNYIVIRIAHASLRRGVSNDWIHGNDQIIEVALSEAQWATFVSSLNMGDGVPCTLQYIAGEGLVPGIEPITDRRDQFNEEVGETLRDALTSLEELRDAAPTKKLRDKAETAIMQLRSNLPFVVREFDSHAETTVERAKMEVNAYVTSAIQRAGLQALGAEAAPLELGTDDTVCQARHPNYPDRQCREPVIDNGRPHFHSFWEPDEG